VAKALDFTKHFLSCPFTWPYKRLPLHHSLPIKKMLDATTMAFSKCYKFHSDKFLIEPLTHMLRKNN
jgi:hypothetical protein